MRAIGGLDVSTARIGYAAPNGALVSIVSAYGADEPVRRLDALWIGLARAIRIHPPIPELMVIEGYALSKPPHIGVLAKIRLGEVGAVARLVCFHLDIPMVEPTPSNLKRFATGRGNASKAEMVAAAIRAGARGSVNEDEADAFHCRRMGLVAHGHYELVTDETDLDAAHVPDWPR